MFRIIISKLYQATLPEIADLPLDESVTPWLYMVYVGQNIFAPIGVQAVCYAEDQDNQTFYYDARYPTVGAVESSWGKYEVMATCGHTGWHLSAVDLVQFMTYMRHAEWLPENQQILSPESRTLMDEFKLGWSKNSDDGGDKAGIFAVVKL